MVTIQPSPCLSLTSVSGWELKPCFKQLQAEATRDQNHLMLASQVVQWERIRLPMQEMQEMQV